MRVLAIMFAAALMLTGCGEGTDTGTVSPAPTPGDASTPADQPVVVEVSIKDGEATPQGDRVQVKVGQEVTLKVTSDAAEEIHVHSDPERTYQVKPGTTLEKSLTLDKPGQVAVEAHMLGVTVVQLVVRP